MRIIGLLCHLSGATLLSACTIMTASDRKAVDLQQEVTATERAFARSMADRDHAAFSAFLSDEAIFFSGPKVLRGKQQVAEAWKRFYEGPTAPFSWQPEQVEVLQSGSLAISSGPVRDAKGKLIATFSSVWRQEAPGVWRIVFDKGNEVCDCTKP
jgi:ketosteroid isomerase-like protein